MVADPADALTCHFTHRPSSARPLTRVRDEEALGSNPATPNRKPQFRAGSPPQESRP